MLTISLLGVSALAEEMKLDVERLRHMVQHDCGSCHGLRLKGGLGPPLEKNLLAARAAEELRQIILEGRAGTAMPAWKFLLSQNEVDWIVQFLQTGKTEEVRP